MSEISQFTKLDSLQSPYSLFWRIIEKDILNYCQKNKITVLAYSSMAQGLLTGKFKTGHKFEKGDHRSQNILFQDDNFLNVQTALKKLEPMSSKYNIKLGQLALVWAFSNPNVCAIAGARNSQQVSENVKAGSIKISEDDLVRISEIGKIVTGSLDDRQIMWNW